MWELGLRDDIRGSMSWMWELGLREDIRGSRSWMWELGLREDIRGSRSWMWELGLRELQVVDVDVGTGLKRGQGEEGEIQIQAG